MFNRRIYRSGHSAVVNIPSNYLVALGWQIGTRVGYYVERGDGEPILRLRAIGGDEPKEGNNGRKI